MLRALGIALVVAIGGCFLFGIFAVAVSRLAPSQRTEGPTSNALVKPLNIKIRNRYAESIFTVDVTVSSKRVDGGTAPIGKKVRVFDRERVAGHSFAERDDVFMVARDAQVKVNFAATSLGEERYFTAKLDPEPQLSTIVIEYDWDVATAAFTISYIWST